MTVKIARPFIILAIIVSLLAVSGCLSSGGGSDATPTPVSSSTPDQSTINIPVPSPGTTIIWTPGSGDTTIINNTNNTRSSPTPVPVISGKAKDWGTDKDTYARGDTATGWVYITNTGNVPIDKIDFTIVIKRTVLFIPFEQSASPSMPVNILPGETQRVEFSQAIPAEYKGMSTAGDYQLTVTAKLAGSEIKDGFSKNIKVT
jgi:hypothetical protein